MVSQEKYESFPCGVLCSASHHFCALFDVDLLQPCSPVSLVHISLFLPAWSTTPLPDCRPSSPSPVVLGLKHSFLGRTELPAPEPGHWTWSVAADLPAGQDPSSQCQNSPASSLPLHGSLHLPAQSAQTLSASPFVQGLREDPSTFFLTPLMLQSLLTFSHCSFTYSTHAHLLQARWPSPPTPREKSPPDMESHILSRELLNGA